MAGRKSSEVLGVEKMIILINNWALYRASTRNNLLGKPKELMTLNRRFTNDFSCHIRDKVI